MKLLKNKKIFLLLLAASFTGLMIYMAFNMMPGRYAVPECKSVIRLMTPVDGQLKESTIILNLVNSGKGEATFYLRGNFKEGDAKHLLSRKIVADYRYEGGYYYFSVKDAKKNPVDTISDQDIDNQAFLINSQHYALKVNKIFDGGYMFSGVRSPIFICSED